MNTILKSKNLTHLHGTKRIQISFCEYNYNHKLIILYTISNM